MYPPYNNVAIYAYKTISFFITKPNKNVYVIINIFTFADLYIYFDKNSECLINVAIYIKQTKLLFFSWTFKLKNFDIKTKKI